MTSLEFQDSGYICLCGSCTCESRVTYTLINPWWSDIISQFSDEIKASFYLGPSARFKERPCSRQIRWHASPEIAESTRTSLYISCPSLLECGIVSRSPNALPLMGTLLERVKAKTNAWLDGHDQTNRQLTLSLIKRGRTAEQQNVNGCSTVVRVLFCRMLCQESLFKEAQNAPDENRCPKRDASARRRRG